MTEPSASRGERERPGFRPEMLDHTVISIPLLGMIANDVERRAEHPDAEPEPFDVVIDVNLDYADGRSEARQRTLALVKDAIRNVRETSSIRARPL